MSEIITITYWSGRSERYVVPTGTAERILAEHNVQVDLPNSVYLSKLGGLPWAREFEREHMYNELAPWECKRKASILVVLQDYPKV